MPPCGNRSQVAHDEHPEPLADPVSDVVRAGRDPARDVMGLARLQNRLDRAFHGGHVALVCPAEVPRTCKDDTHPRSGHDFVHLLDPGPVLDDEHVHQGALGVTGPRLRAHGGDGCSRVIRRFHMGEDDGGHPGRQGLGDVGLRLGSAVPEGRDPQDQGMRRFRGRPFPNPRHVGGHRREVEGARFEGVEDEVQLPIPAHFSTLFGGFRTGEHPEEELAVG